MSENLKKVLNQFAVEGLDGDWSVIYTLAQSELKELEQARQKLIAMEDLNS